MRAKLYTLLLLLISAFTQAQGPGPEMADAMRENGKIYVVIGVLLIIFVSIVGLLLMLERKIKKLEDKLKK